MLRRRELRSYLSLALISGGIILGLVPLWTWLYGLTSQALLARQASVVTPPAGQAAAQEKQGDGSPETTSPKAEAWPLTRLVIPRLDLEVVVVEGVDEAALRRGPGHYPGTALPGEEGNVGIAGHRNAWGRWFRNLHRLEPGDAVFLVTETTTYYYRVTDKWITDAYDWSVVAPTAAPSLTLTTCELPVQKKQRLIVRAVLAETPGRPDVQP